MYLIDDEGWHQGAVVTWGGFFAPSQKLTDELCIQRIKEIYKASHLLGETCFKYFFLHYIMHAVNHDIVGANRYDTLCQSHRKKKRANLFVYHMLRQMLSSLYMG